MDAKVAKAFGWESAHRLPNHAGKCRHLHGHSYRMTVELTGVPDEFGIVIDFKDIKSVVAPLVEQWDHATLVAESDDELLDTIERLGDRCVVLPFETTAENLCTYVANYVRTEASTSLRERGIKSVRVRINETESCYAECEVSMARGITSSRSGVDQIDSREPLVQSHR